MQFVSKKFVLLDSDFSLNQQKTNFLP
jgi:hypothetical protein